MDASETRALLQRARAGSREAIDALFSRCAGKLFAIVRLRLGATLRGELQSVDIVQATFLKAFQHLDRFDGASSGSLMAWLAQIAQHEMADQADFHTRARRDARRRTALDPIAEQLAAATQSILTGLIRDERAAMLERALQNLPAHYREVIVLRKLEERSFTDIAQRMGRTDDACRMLLARALTALTLALQSQVDRSARGVRASEPSAPERRDDARGRRTS